MRVKEFVHNCSGIKSDIAVKFFVELVGKPIGNKANIIADWYNECPYMFDDADVSSWAVKQDDDGIVIEIHAFSY